VTGQISYVNARQIYLETAVTMESGGIKMTHARTPFCSKKAGAPESVCVPLGEHVVISTQRRIYLYTHARGHRLSSFRQPTLRLCALGPILIRLCGSRLPAFPPLSFCCCCHSKCSRGRSRIIACVWQGHNIVVIFIN
jgi:hypothetical protein